MRHTARSITLSAACAAVLAACSGGDAANDSAASKQANQARSIKTAASSADYQDAVQALYIAYFGRPADPAGLQNMEAALAAAGAPKDIPGLGAAYASNAAVASLVDSFGTSAESVALYGNGSAADFVTAIYQHVLGRAPLSAGLNFWAGALDSGSLSRGDVALSIMVGALTNNSTQGTQDGTLVDNRIAAAEYFTAQLASQNATPLYKGQSAVAIARTMLSSVIAATSASDYQADALSAVASLETQASPGSEILIPLYVYPSDPGSWAPVVGAKQANPNTGIVAVINPDSGPGSAVDPNYASAVAQLKAAGITVFGYIHTSYGAASIASLETQMQQYVQWYGPSGMFFDEMANTAGFESYYGTLTSYANSLGMATTVGNPGTDTVPSYIGTVSTMVIFENAGMPSASFLSGGWHASYSPANFAYIAYGVGNLDTAAETADAAYVRYRYITNQALPNPYNALPPYLSTEVSLTP